MNIHWSSGMLYDVDVVNDVKTDEKLNDVVY